MRPGPIPDAELFGEQRRTIGAPPGHETTTGPVEASVAPDPEYGHRYRVRLSCTPEEAARLARGEPAWLTFWGGIVPFAVEMHPLCGCDPELTDERPLPGPMERAPWYCQRCGGSIGQPADAECTGVAASWCPVHGVCSCPRIESGEQAGERTLQDPGCPLHGRQSQHAEESP